MSDYEEEHFPVGIKTSFSSSFDAAWRESADVADFAPIRRSFSEFYRGERITVDTVGHKYEDGFQNVSSEEEIQNFVDDNSLNDSAVTNIGSGNLYVTATKSSVCNDIQSKSLQPELDTPTDSFVSEHCSVNSECINGYRSKDAHSGRENGAAAAKQSDSSMRIGLRKEGTQSQHASTTVNDAVRHRAVSDIRNNIPDVGNVKSCSDSGSEVRQPSPDTVLRGEFARFRKRSPGVAKRLEATTPSQADSVDMSVISLAEVYEPDEAAVVRHNPESSSSQPSTPFMGSVLASSRMHVIVPAVNAEGTYTENETSRPKRRELSNIVDSSQMSRMWESLTDVSARTTDPFRYSGMLPDAVLFTTCDDPVADQTIRLSPELTECDSDNVSTLEEDIVDDVVDGCLPVVEDGLSCSDTDELPTSVQTSSPSNFSSAAFSDVVDSSNKFPVSETEVMDFFSGTADNSSITTMVKDDPVERAIRDIRLAMERSKGFTGGSPRRSQSLKQQSSHQDAESVWVSRAE